MKKILISFTIFILIFTLHAQENYTYRRVEPFVVKYSEIEIPLLGNGKEIQNALGEPDLQLLLEGEQSITGLQEIGIKYGDFFVIRYHPVTKNILDISTNQPEIELFGKKIIGMKIDELLNSTEYDFKDMKSNGYYRYVNLNDYQIIGLDREIEGNLQLTLVVENDRVDWIYMRFSEYQYAP